MISFNFEYYRPDTKEEAVQLFKELNGQQKRPMYLSGGTEIISLGRMNEIYTNAVIDIKNITECNVMEEKGNKLYFGSVKTLTQIAEGKLFPLLSDVVSRIADHTNQCKITLGGNLAAKIIYREAALPLMLADATLVIYGPSGERQVSFNDIFVEKLHLNEGEFILQAIVDASYKNLPSTHIKKTKIDKIDYPLTTFAVLKKDGQYRTAFSGLCPFPFRSTHVESVLNNRLDRLENRINNAANNLPAPVINDILGSSDYRLFVFKKTLTDVLFDLEGVD